MLIRWRSMRRGMLLLLLLLLIPHHYAATTPAHDVYDDDDNHVPPYCDSKYRASGSHLRHHRYDPLVCWLWNLQVGIPNQSFREGFVSVDIQDMVCTNFTMQSLQSLYRPSDHDDDTTTGNNSSSIMDVQVSGVQATCVGRYHVTPGGLGGSVHAMVQQGTTATTLSSTSSGNNNYSLALSLNVSSTFVHIVNNNTNGKNGTTTMILRMPCAVNATDCTANLQVTSLYFDGSFSAKLVNLFRASIQAYVTNALRCALPNAIGPLVSDDATRAVQQVDKWLRVLLLPNDDTVQHSSSSTATASTTRGAARAAALSQSVTTKRNDNDTIDRTSAADKDDYHHPATVLPPERMVDWKVDTPIAYHALEWFNKFLDNHLNKGFLASSDKDTCNDWSSSSSSVDEDDCGFLFSGINGLLQVLTHHIGQVDIVLQPNQVQLELPSLQVKVLLTFHRVQVGGIDKFAAINVLRPRSRRRYSSNRSEHTRNDSIVFESKLSTNNDFNLNVTMDVEVLPMMNSSSNDGGERMVEQDKDNDDSLLKESFTVSVTASHANASAGLVLDYDKRLFHNVHMQDIVMAIQNNRNISQWSCLLAPMQSLNITDLALNANLSTMVVTPSNSTGRLEKDLDGLLNSVLQLILAEYQPLVTESLSALVRGQAHHALNDVIENWIKQQQQQHSTSFPQTCRPVPANSTSPPDFVNFGDLHILRQLNDLLSKSLGTINDCLVCIANVFNQRMRPVAVAFENMLHVNVTNVSVQEPGCVQQLDVLLPSRGAFELTNSLQFGQCKNATNRDPGLLAHVNVSSPFYKLDGSFNVSVWLDNVTLSGGSLIKYDLNDFRRLPLSSMLSNGLCAAVPIVDLQLLPPKLLLELPGLNFSSIVKSSAFNSARINFSSDNQKGVTSAVQSLLSWAMTSAEELTNGVVKALLASGTVRNGTRSDVPLPEANNDSYEYSTLLVALITTAVFVIINVFLLCITRCKRRPSTEALLSEPFLRHDDHLETNRNDAIAEGGCTKPNGALFLSKAVPTHARHLLPIAILGTFLLLVSSNLSVGASVEVTLSSDRGKTEFHPSFNGSTLQGMITPVVYPLLLLVLGCSGVWPYAKLLLTLYGWCAPTGTLGVLQRGHMLSLLDAFGKFSLVGTFVLVFAMVSFRMHLVLDGMVMIDVYINPAFGFYGFLLAFIASLIVGRAALFFHRQSFTGVQSLNETSESLCQHEFDDEEEDGSRRQMSTFLSGTIVGGIVVASVLLSIGITRRSIVVEVGGLAGKLMDGGSPISTYSVLTLGSSLPQGVEYPSAIGMAFLQTVYFGSCVIMPFALLVLLCLLWLVPMTYAWQKRIMSLAEICSAWSAVEVFAISLFALPGLSALTSSIVDDKCEFVNYFLATHFDDALHGDDKCCNITLSVASNVWWLACGVVLNSTIASLVNGVAHRALRERMERQDDDDIKDLCEAPHDDDQSRDEFIARPDVISVLLHSRFSSLLFEPMLPSTTTSSAGQQQHREGGRGDDNHPRERASVDLLHGMARVLFSDLANGSMLYQSTS